MLCALEFLNNISLNNGDYDIILMKGNPHARLRKTTLEVFEELEKFLELCMSDTVNIDTVGQTNQIGMLRLAAPYLSIRSFQ